MIDEKFITEVLLECWSIKSSSLWTKENPAKGQCGVTALVINEIYGGEILKTKLPNNKWHYYNFINGKSYDFTKSQFENDIEYQDVASNRVEALTDTNEEQYNFLFNDFNNRVVE
jgi:xanthine dehydrogenase iron-sulfur cluster and FAD-binding subunit A